MSGMGGQRGRLLQAVTREAGRRLVGGGAVPAAVAGLPAGVRLGRCQPGAAAPQGRGAAGVVAGGPGAAHLNSYQYCWFCEGYNAWSGPLDVVMRQISRAGGRR